MTTTGPWFWPLASIQPSPVFLCHQRRTRTSGQWRSSSPGLKPRLYFSPVWVTVTESTMKRDGFNVLSVYRHGSGWRPCVVLRCGQEEAGRGRRCVRVEWKGNHSTLVTTTDQKTTLPTTCRLQKPTPFGLLFNERSPNLCLQKKKNWCTSGMTWAHLTSQCNLTAVIRSVGAHALSHNFSFQNKRC